MHPSSLTSSGSTGPDDLGVDGGDEHEECHKGEEEIEELHVVDGGCWFVLEGSGGVRNVDTCRQGECSREKERGLCAGGVSLLTLG
jgi:hypothetical protein